MTNIFTIYTMLLTAYTDSILWQYKNKLLLPSKSAYINRCLNIVTALI